MGNYLTCFKSQGATLNPLSNIDSNPSTNHGTRPSTFTTTTGTISYTNDGGSSVTSSSAGQQSQSQFSAEASNGTGTSSIGEILPTSSLKVYSFSDMRSATKGFKSDTVLGVGGFGTVYKGWVDENTLEPCKVGTGIVVAVKKLNHESVQGFQEWQLTLKLTASGTK